MKTEEMAALHTAAFDGTRPWTAKEFADLLESDAAFSVGDTRAFALGHVIVDEAELLTLATSPSSRRRGLGRACLDAFVQEAKVRGATSAFLEVASDNTAALALYRSAGFEAAGCRRNYYKRRDGPPADAVVMRRALS